MFVCELKVQRNMTSSLLCQGTRQQACMTLEEILGVHIQIHKYKEGSMHRVGIVSPSPMTYLFQQDHSSQFFPTKYSQRTISNFLSLARIISFKVLLWFWFPEPTWLFKTICNSSCQGSIILL